VKGVKRKLDNEKFQSFYSLLSINRMVKSRRKIWAGHES
jgi:hypothetical protein